MIENKPVTRSQEKKTADPVGHLHGLMFEKKEAEALSFIKTMPKVDVLSPDGQAIIVSASMLNCLSVVRYLAEQTGMHVDFSNKEGFTGLMLASLRGHGQVVEYLLDRGANPNALSQTGVSPLMYAIECGDLGIVKSLIAKKANPLHVEPGTGLSMVRLAELEGRPEIADYLRSLDKAALAKK